MVTYTNITPFVPFSLLLSLCLSFSLSLCNMSQPLRIHNPSSYSSARNNNIWNNHSCIPSSFPSSSSLSLVGSSSTSRYSSPISISFRPLPSLTVSSNQHPHQLSDSSPLSSVDLIPISNDEQFDQVVGLTHHRHNPLIIAWMANWCRKCIYLKPKLEKLAAEYYPRLRFYSVDVNTVSHKLVARAGVTKMPTIQLWKDGKKQAEVIGGQKAYWVIGDVQEMIGNECTM